MSDQLPPAQWSLPFRPKNPPPEPPPAPQWTLPFRPKISPPAPPAPSAPPVPGHDQPAVPLPSSPVPAAVPVPGPGRFNSLTVIRRDKDDATHFAQAIERQRSTLVDGSNAPFELAYFVGVSRQEEPSAEHPAEPFPAGFGIASISASRHMIRPSGFWMETCRSSDHAVGRAVTEALALALGVVEKSGATGGGVVRVFTDSTIFLHALDEARTPRPLTHCKTALAWYLEPVFDTMAVLVRLLESMGVAAEVHWVPKGDERFYHRTACVMAKHARTNPFFVHGETSGMTKDLEEKVEAAVKFLEDHQTALGMCL